jgi:hypothetical protein
MAKSCKQYKKAKWQPCCASDQLKQRLKGGSKINKKDKARSLKGLDDEKTFSTHGP